MNSKSTTPKSYGSLISIRQAQKMKSEFEVFAREALKDKQPEAYVYDKDFILQLLQASPDCAYLKVYFGMDKGKLQLMLAPADGTKRRIPVLSNPPVANISGISTLRAAASSEGEEYLADKGGACPPPWGDV